MEVYSDVQQMMVLLCAKAHLYSPEIEQTQALSYVHYANKQITVGYYEST